MSLLPPLMVTRKAVAALAVSLASSAYYAPADVVNCVASASPND